MKRSIFKITIKLISTLSLFAVCGFAVALTHTVEKGETYYSISKKYGITIDELCSKNGLSQNDTLLPGKVLNIPSAPLTYTVQKGDTISKIAKEYNISVDELLKMNGLEKSSVLKIDQVLKVPFEKKQDSVENQSGKNSQRQFDTYTVQKGDTYYHIAKINGITVEELRSLNNLDKDSVLKTGEQLKIPVTIVDTNKARLPSLPVSTQNDPRNYSSKKGDSNLVWPVKSPEVKYIQGKVSGVQLSAEKNENVTVIRAGTVMYVGNYRGYGQVVFVQSKTGHIYSYTSLGSVKVKKGDYVVFGDVLGTAGMDSLTGSYQCGLMVFQKGVPIDPAKAPRG